MSGLSKISGLPQMKAAWLVTSGPEPLKKQALERIEVIADTYLSMNAPIQLALPTFLQQRHGFQKQVLTRVRRNVGRAGPAIDVAEVMQPAGNRRRMVCGGARAGDAHG